MDTLTETAAAITSASLVHYSIATAESLAIWGAIMFSGVTFAASFMMWPMLSALSPRYTTPSHYAWLYNLSTAAANPFAIISGLSSALIVLLSDDNDEKLAWTGILMLIIVLLARTSQRKTAGSKDRMEEEDDDKTLLNDGVDDGVEIKRQLILWRRLDIGRFIGAMCIGILTLVKVVLW